MGEFKEFVIQVPESKIDDLLECEAVVIGGVVFVKRSIVIDLMVEFANKKVMEYRQQTEN